MLKERKKKLFKKKVREYLLHKKKRHAR